MEIIVEQITSNGEVASSVQEDSWRFWRAYKAYRLKSRMWFFVPEK